MKTAVCIFCYSGDSDILPLCVESVRHTFPTAAIHVFDDEQDPIYTHAWKAISQYSVNYKTTSFPRGGNLRGKDCIMGMLLEMKKAGRGCDSVIKADCDTLVMGRKWHDDFLDSHRHAVASLRHGSLFSGICYSLKTDFLDRLIRRLEPLPLPETAGEDVVIGALTSMYAYPHGYIYHLPQSRENQTSRWTAYNYAEPVSPGKYARLFDVVTFGNNFVYGLPPESRIAPMRAVLDARKEQEAARP